MEGSQIPRANKRPRKTMKETIKKYLEKLQGRLLRNT